MQIIAGHVVIPGVPDYAERPRYGYTHATEVTASELGASGSETRNSAWSGFRRKQEWRIKTCSGAETFAVEEAIRSALEAKKAAVPWLPQARKVKSVIGNVLELDTEPDGMELGTLVWWVDTETRANGYATSAGASGANLSLGSAEGLTSNCLIAPLVFGILASASASQRTANGSTYFFTFRESMSGSTNPVITYESDDIGFVGTGGDTCELSVLATGREPLVYSWTPSDGENSPFLTLVADLTTAGHYVCTVSNAFGSDTSRTFTIGQLEIWDGVQDDDLDTVTVDRTDPTTATTTLTPAETTTGIEATALTDPTTATTTMTPAETTTGIEATALTDPTTTTTTMTILETLA